MERLRLSVVSLPCRFFNFSTLKTQDPPAYLAESLEDFLVDGAMEALNGIIAKYKGRMESIDKEITRVKKAMTKEKSQQGQEKGGNDQSKPKPSTKRTVQDQSNKNLKELKKKRSLCLKTWSSRWSSALRITAT